MDSREEQQERQQLEVNPSPAPAPVSGQWASIRVEHTSLVFNQYNRAQVARCYQCGAEGQYLVIRVSSMTGNTYEDPACRLCAQKWGPLPAPQQPQEPPVAYTDGCGTFCLDCCQGGPEVTPSLQPITPANEPEYLTALVCNGCDKEVFPAKPYKGHETAWEDMNTWISGEYFNH